MPRSIQEILDHADELADRFEKLEVDPATAKDAAPLRELRAAVLARGEADKAVAAAVTDARRAGISWAAIGAYLGTSGQAASQRYGSLVSR